MTLRTKVKMNQILACQIRSWYLSNRLLHGVHQGPDPAAVALVRVLSVPKLLEPLNDDIGLRAEILKLLSQHPKDAVKLEVFLVRGGCNMSVCPGYYAICTCAQNG